MPCENGEKTVTPRKKRRWLPWCLMAAAVVCAAVFAALWAEMRARHQAEAEEGAARAARLEAQLEETEKQRQEEADGLRGQLAELERLRDEDRALIARLEEHSLLTPEGETPEYTRLYPELYAAPWQGETVSGGKTVCLTFDDGPSCNTERILEILDQYGVKATFFVIGKTGQADQQRMRDIVAAGHTLAIHSWSHDYRKIYASVEAYLEDFNRLYEWIYQVTGVHPQIFRMPGGSVNGYDRGLYQEIISELLRRGFVYYDWNASAQDATATPLSPEVITENCLKGLGKDLVVMLAHDGAARDTTVEALPAVIQGYLDRGYAFSALTPGVTPVIMGYRDGLR